MSRMARLIRSLSEWISVGAADFSLLPKPAMLHVEFDRLDGRAVRIGETDERRAAAQGFDPNSLSISTLVKSSCAGCPVQYYSGSFGGGMYTRTIAVQPPPAVSGRRASNRVMSEQAFDLVAFWYEGGFWMYPVALLGLKKNQNLFVDKSGKWNADYIPAYARRYPFCMARVTMASSFGRSRSSGGFAGRPI